MDEKTKKVMENGIKDTMWMCFWKGKQKANLNELEECVMRLVRMATQKNAGQRGDATCISWETLDIEFMRIAVEATALVLDSRFEELKKQWENE